MVIIITVLWHSDMYTVCHPFKKIQVILTKSSFIRKVRGWLCIRFKRVVFMTDIHPLIRHNLLKKNIQSKVELESKARQSDKFCNIHFKNISCFYFILSPHDSVCLKLYYVNRNFIHFILWTIFKNIFCLRLWVEC